MKVKALKIAVIYGMAVSIGDEFELEDKVAKVYLKNGFVEKVEQIKEVVEVNEVATEDIQEDSLKKDTNQAKKGK